MPKSTEQEILLRKTAIQDATKNAIEVPLKVMKLAYESMEIMKAMAEVGNPNSVSDAGVGALCARTAVEGAYLNVKINAAGYDDKQFIYNLQMEAESILESSKIAEKEILEVVQRKIDK